MCIVIVVVLVVVVVCTIPYSVVGRCELLDFLLVSLAALQLNMLL